MKKALFIRMDRIGDLILTLPSDQLLGDGYQVHWAIPKGLEFVVDHAQPKKSYQSFSKDFSWTNFYSFLKFVRDLKPDVSISFHVPWWINFALWLARVPERGGVLSQWHSYAYLNKGLRQKRSRCEFHEMEYNFILVEHVFGFKRNREKWLPQKLQIGTGEAVPIDLNRKYIVVHPGMGGSALNWTTDNYLKFINDVSEKIPVVITGTKIDQDYLQPLKTGLSENGNVTWLDNQLNGNQLLQILAMASAVIAPSTGVLHLGASLGVPSLGIYSPIQVHHANRWGPQGPNTKVFLPHVKCPGQFECLGKDCQFFNCMASISPDSVAQSLQL